VATIITKTNNIVNPIDAHSCGQQATAQWACPDEFFTTKQIQRLQELTQRLQNMERPMEEVLTAEEQQELKTLIKAEIVAATRRSASLISKSEA
jgi:hypothetical protein